MKGKIILLLSALTLVCGCKSQSKSEEKKFYSNLFDKSEKQEGEKFVQGDEAVTQSPESTELKTESLPVLEPVVEAIVVEESVQSQAVPAETVEKNEAAIDNGAVVTEQVEAIVTQQEDAAKAEKTETPAVILENK